MKLLSKWRLVEKTQVCLFKLEFFVEIVIEATGQASSKKLVKNMSFVEKTHAT